MKIDKYIGKRYVYRLIDLSYIADHVQVGICLKRIYKHAGLERVMRGFNIKPG